MHEGGPLQADLDKGALHAGQHAHHLAQVDVAHLATLNAAFNVQLLHRALGDERDPRFEWRDVNEDVFSHESSCGDFNS